MNVVIRINCDNTAFDGDNAGYEVGRILNVLAHRLKGKTLIDGESFTLSDINGNMVGEMTVGVRTGSRTSATTT